MKPDYMNIAPAGFKEIGGEATNFQILSVAGPISGAVKNGKVGVGNFYVKNKEEFEDLGPRIEVLVVSAKPNRRFHNKGVTVCKGDTLTNEAFTKQKGYNSLELKVQKEFGELTDKRDCKVCPYFEFKLRVCKPGLDLMILDVTDGKFSGVPKMMFLENSSMIKGESIRGLQKTLRAVEATGYPRTFAVVLEGTTRFSENGPTKSYAPFFSITSKLATQEWFEVAEALRLDKNPTQSEAPSEEEPEW